MNHNEVAETGAGISRRSVLRGATAGATLLGVSRLAPGAASIASSSRVLTLLETPQFDHCCPLAASPGGEVFVYAAGTWERQDLYISPTTSFSTANKLLLGGDVAVSEIRAASFSDDCKRIAFHRARRNQSNYIETVGEVTSTTSFCTDNAVHNTTESTMFGASSSGTVWKEGPPSECIKPTQLTLAVQSAGTEVQFFGGNTATIASIALGTGNEIASTLVEVPYGSSGSGTGSGSHQEFPAIHKPTANDAVLYGVDDQGVIQTGPLPTLDVSTSTIIHAIAGHGYVAYARMWDTHQVDLCIYDSATGLTDVHTETADNAVVLPKVILPSGAVLVFAFAPGLPANAGSTIGIWA
ncbi:MAG: hypothetical protein AAF682_14590 [Planctomycetota bacterium]